ncbi:MAG: hypothetical protein HY042_07685, partial [Spirochaetia bacterium]|nr:hypothetical protein [Spirochaetia bacterium]
MNFRYLYAAALFFLVVMYAVFLEPGGFRLPRYYTPDGLIVPVGDVTADWLAVRLIEVGGKETLEAPAIFPTSDPVQVRTDAGVGIMRVIPNNLWRVLVDFKFVILFSFVFLLCGLWFLESGNDIYLSAFCLLMSVFFFSAVISLGAHGLHFLWQMAAFALIPSLLNMALRTTGKEISGYLLLLELILVMFFSLIAFVGSAYTFFTLRVGTAVAYYLMIAVVIGIQLDNALRASEDPVERLKRWALVAGSVLGLLVPSLALPLLPYWHTSGDPLLYVFLPGLIFPVSLLYGTYRLQLVPYQFIITRSILAGALTIFLVGVYSVALLAH